MIIVVIEGVLFGLVDHGYGEQLFPYETLVSIRKVLGWHRKRKWLVEIWSLGERTWHYKTICWRFTVGQTVLHIRYNC